MNRTVKDASRQSLRGTIRTWPGACGSPCPDAPCHRLQLRAQASSVGSMEPPFQAVCVAWQDSRLQASIRTTSSRDQTASQSWISRVLWAKRHRRLQQHHAVGQGGPRHPRGNELHSRTATSGQCRRQTSHKRLGNAAEAVDDFGRVGQRGHVGSLVLAWRKRRASAGPLATHGHGDAQPAGHQGGADQDGRGKRLPEARSS